MPGLGSGSAWGLARKVADGAADALKAGEGSAEKMRAHRQGFEDLLADDMADAAVAEQTLEGRVGRCS